MLSVAVVTFLHNKTACFKDFQAQELLQNRGIDFFLPDPTVRENIGSVLKDCVEGQTVSIRYAGILSLNNNLRRELSKTEFVF